MQAYVQVLGQTAQYLFRGQAMTELGRDDASSALLAGLEVSEQVEPTRARLLFELGRFEEVLALDRVDLMTASAAALKRSEPARGPN